MDFKYACMHACIQILAQYIIWKGQNEIEKYLCENNIISVKRCQGTRVSTTISANINTNFSFLFFFWLNLLMMEQQPLNEELFQITLWWLEFPIVPSKASFPCSHHDGSKFLEEERIRSVKETESGKKKTEEKTSSNLLTTTASTNCIAIPSHRIWYCTSSSRLFSVLSLSLSHTHTHTQMKLDASIYLSIYHKAWYIYLYLCITKLDTSIYLSQAWWIYLSVYLSQSLMHLSIYLFITHLDASIDG